MRTKVTSEQGAVLWQQHEERQPRNKYVIISMIGGKMLVHVPWCLCVHAYDKYFWCLAGDLGDSMFASGHENYWGGPAATYMYPSMNRKSFDRTLGFPGEGPPPTSGHDWRY
jgi:hypothetical protein